MTTPSIDSSAASAPPALSHRQILTILSGLLLGMFLAALDQNIVSVAIVRIANSLHGFDQQAWATTAYLITSTISTPLYGKLADIYGRKPFFLAAITIFVAGSAACTFAGSMYELAGYRAFQGLGAGGLMSLVLTIIGDIVPARERARYQGYFMMVFGGSTVLGPVLGGLFSGYDKLWGLDGWRWVFLVNVPVGILALIVVARVLNLTHERRQVRVDWYGAVALTICVVPLLIVAEQGRAWGWASSKALLCFGIGAAGLVLFLVAEALMKDAALIPLRLFRNATFTVTIVGGFIVGIAMFGSLSMVPLYLQVVRGFSPTKAGLLMLPMVAGIVVGSLMSGQVVRRTGRYKILPVTGTAVIAAGALLYAQVAYDSPLWEPLLIAVLLGFGLGCCMQTLTIAAQNAGPRSDMGVSTASSTFFRQVGGTLGVAVFLTILFNQLPHKILAAFGGMLPPGFDAARLGDLQANTSVIDALPATVRDPILIGFTDSLHVVLYSTSGVALLACVVLLFMKEIPLLDPVAKPAEPTPADDPEWAEDQVYLGAAQAISAPEPMLAVDTATAAEQARYAALSSGLKAALANGNGFAGAGQRPAADPAGAVAMLPAAPPAGAGGDLAGRVLRADGVPVAGAVLTLIDQRGHQVSRARGDRDGAFGLEQPAPGNYVLIVSAGGYQPTALNLAVDLGPLRVEVTLHGSGELSGVVRRAGDGEPVPGATVTLTDMRGEVIGATVSGSAGEYSYPGMVAGVYTLVAVAPRLRPAAATLSVPDSGVLHYDIELGSLAALTGEVSADGRPVPDAWVSVLDESGATVGSARTDADGRYLVPDLSEGSYRVVARGYPPVTSRVTLASGEFDHNVRLGYDQTEDMQ
ncbi:MFS transporter [Nocardia aurantia]|uniref:Putative multidrug resistance protein MdtD n=1 Tax=Nocardia aurantia TaxID=2585199 RepID=A0A7K0DUT7_9NOCA|nr:MFS transporter [Nocardia aurantia]MQY29521.1 putative multidrug resistance protein MdtD [Nocardia aurantia]